ncbi:MAG: polyprenyl synthetase family protein [Candidatus Sericytochromatia bacterium]|uniref:Polyprenyl synthetase family protein n=1 Tax=Candidatus Tanganyikabacteria bacterium TaxID=2961651 RepID=A0A937X609_9BACT|nr:polyprenyl synthetase family protein [Candidatus Tanganyikabacteria bacterium]
MRAEAATYRSAVSDLEAAKRHLDGAGKAIRARCVRLIGAALGQTRENSEFRALESAIESLHLGTLIHDDVLDESPLRRGRSAVHVAFGTKVALLAGDVLVSRAGILIASLGSPYLSRRFAEVLGDLCEGELLQDDQRWRFDLKVDEYLLRIDKKTSGLFELACEGAAILSAATDRHVDPLPGGPTAATRSLGRHLGRLFQMTDDLGDEAGGFLPGKPAHQDAAAGHLSLLTVCALADPDVGPPYRALLEAGAAPSDFDAKRLRDRPEVSERVRQVLTAEYGDCLMALEQLPGGRDREDLSKLALELLARSLQAAAITAPPQRLRRKGPTDRPPGVPIGQ